VAPPPVAEAAAATGPAVTGAAVTGPVAPRRASRFGWREQVVFALVTAILGLLIVVQLRTQQEEAGLASLTAQDLTVLVANLNTRNGELRDEVATLERESANLGVNQERGQSSLDQIRRDLAKIRAWSGLDPVSGKGVRILVTGPIDGVGVEELLNELRNAGAEAISVGGVRVVAGTVVSGGVGSVGVENTLLGDPFEIVAIGQPEVLTGTLTRVGGVISLLSATHPRVQVAVVPGQGLVAPATTRTLAPVNGAPRL
jgi:uncharacterized protein YlxW (UPF0749 family)